MKIKNILFTVLVSTFLSNNLFAHKQEPTYQQHSVDVNGVNFMVDPRIELFHTLELLQGIPLINYVEIDYKQKIFSQFKKYQALPIFDYLSKNPMYGSIFKTIDGPIWFLLHLTEDLEWRDDIPDIKSFDPKVDSLRLLMQDFVQKTNYPEFFNANKAFFDISLSTLIYNLTPFNEKQRLVQYCTNSSGDDLQFNVIINFLGWGNFGPRIQTKDTYEMYAVLAPSKNNMQIPTFDIGSLYKLLWHEFAHSFTNPAIEAYEEGFSALNHLWPPVKESMKAQAYDSWESVIKEQLTESIACRMAASRFGDDVAELNYIRYQKGMDWMYITPIMRSLRKYEQNRDKYPTLTSFMPELLTDLKKITDIDIESWSHEASQIRTLKKNTIPTIDDIYGKDSVLFIVSSQETDSSADLRLKKFIESIRDRIFKNAEIVSDSIALNMDLSKYHLSVWGTPHGNLFLQKYLSNIPVLIKTDKVVAENEYLGTGYGMLISWPNPVNTSKTMAIYTAQNPRDLIDFNRIMNGAGNYHIFKNFVSLKVGEFKKWGGVWLAK